MPTHQPVRLVLRQQRHHPIHHRFCDTGFSQLVGAAMRDVPPHQYAMGGAGRTPVFQMSIALGVAVAVAIIGRPTGPVEALTVYDDAWLVCAGAFAMVAVTAGVLYPPKQRRATAPVD